ncbi:MAG: hypothetical protein ACOC8E_02545 [Planctomycetota bacterium]
MRFILLTCLMMSISAAAFAAVLCPRVLSEHNADTSDLTRFRRFQKWKDKTGQDLAIAVWKYTCDTATGLYHMNEVLDGPDPSREFSTVRDPLKILNVYNVGYCGIFGPTLSGIFHGVGFEKTRSFGVPKWNHTTTEVWYDNAWHYFDLDVRGALMKPDGVIASVEEARKDRGLWVNPKRTIKPFFPHDHNKARVFNIYRTSRIDYNYRWFQMGHTMDFRLRQGESLTRWWHPQGGRWHHNPRYNKGFVRKLLLKKPIGFKSNHADFSVWTQGNGLWHYAPNLTADSTDFADGIERVTGLRPGKNGLELTAAAGEAVFEFFTPWIIVAKINDLDDPGDDCQAAIVRLDAAAPLTVLASTNNGIDWAEAAKLDPGRHSLDLTEHVKGTYGYLLKLAATGKPGQTALRSIAVDTWVQVAPISLPRLKKGANRCRYEMGDRYDTLTVPRLVAPNCADPEDLKKYVLELPDRYTPKRISRRMRGDVVMELRAPKGRKIAWFTAGAAFTTHQGAGAKNTANRIAYALGEPKDFREVYRADCPMWINHWRYQWDEDVRLDEPAEAVYLKYTGRPAVNVLRATLHLTPRAKPRKAIEITHGYTVNGKPVEKVVQLDGPGDYTVHVDGDPKNMFVTMTVPSK